MTTLTYNTLQDWLGDEIHVENIDIGPDGDIYAGQVEISGDRWKHKRLGLLYAPGSTVTSGTVDPAAIEAPCGDLVADTDSGISVTYTNGFADGDYVLIEDSNHQEVGLIDNIVHDQSLNLTETVDNSYNMSDGLLVSTLRYVDVVKNTNIVQGDYVAIHSKSKDNQVMIYKILNSNDCTEGRSLEGVNNTLSDEYTRIYIEKLALPVSRDDKLYVINTNTKWTRDTDNPLFGLQTEYPWDWAGDGIESGRILDGVDTYEKDEKEEWNKPGLFFSGNREKYSSQIGLALSKEEQDYYNWSQFLGNQNPKKLNPIIRHGNETETFNGYADSDELHMVWDSEDSDLTISLDTTTAMTGVTCLKCEYTDAGELWGLMPVPMNFEVTSDDTNGSNYNYFQFNYKGSGTNTQGDITVKLLAADGTSTTHTFENVLRGAATGSTSFDFSSFAGRKYIRSVIFDVQPDSTPSGTDTLYIDNVRPFMPAVWDEIVSDPAIIQGDERSAPGVMAMYYTARERPRVSISSSVSSQGQSSVSITVSDGTKFIDNDLAIIFDQDHYEVCTVSGVSGNDICLQYVGYGEDSASTYAYDYDADKMARVANNSYRVTKIGGAYTIDDNQDTSNWVKWRTRADRRIVLDVGAAGAWDSLAVKQPSVKYRGNAVYMAYVGESTGEYAKIGFAQSTNFTTFTKFDGNPFIEPGSTFDSNGCYYPDLNMWLPKSMIHYTGDDGTKRTIGSAVQESSFSNPYKRFHVSLLVYPMSSLGYPPVDGAVLFDMGNFWVEVTHENMVQAHAYVDGQWYTAEPTPEQSMNMGFGHFLMHDHWNYIVAQFTGDQLECYRVSMMPRIGGGNGFENGWGGADYFARSPWMMTNGVVEGDTSVTLTRQYSWVDGVTDYEGSGQDILFWGRPAVGATEYMSGAQVQLNRIVNVTDNGDDTYDCDLLNPIGPWGFSNVQQFPGASYHGVMLAQGHLKSSQQWRDLVRDYLDTSTYPSGYMSVHLPSVDINHMFSFTYNTSNQDGQGYGLPDVIWKKGYTSVSSEGPKILDPSLSMPPMLGNGYNLALQDQNKKAGYTVGYIGHCDIGLDILFINPQGEVGGMVPTYRQFINNGDASFPMPPWYKFDLSDDGAMADMHQSLGFWDFASNFEGAGNLITDNSGKGNTLYLRGGATVIEGGYLGYALNMTNKTTDCAECQLYTEDFNKLNAGDYQIDVGSSGEWDENNIQAPHLFKAIDSYNMLYSGEGRIPPRGGPGEKKPVWHSVWSTSSAGTQTMPETYVAMPGTTTDYFYSVRWAIILANTHATGRSPIVNNFTVEYTDPGQVPSTAFMTAQNSTNSTPIYRVQLVPASGAREDEKINITDYITSISDLNSEVPVKPDDLGNIVAGDVTLIVNNEDRYFSELDTSSIFYNRNYLSDEIRIFTGFQLSSRSEYYLSGRYYIDRVEISNDETAQIYCRSLLREAIDTKLGMPVDNTPDPKIYQGQWRVKDIMHDLLFTEANIPGEDIFLEDYEQYFSNVTIQEQSIGDVLFKLAQACDGVVYTNNQGDIYFKTWGNITSHSATTGVTLTENDNAVTVKYTGQRRDRLVKEAVVTGEDFVQASATSGTLTYGKTVKIENPYIQEDDVATTIANNIIRRYNTVQAEMEINSAYLPSLKLLDTVKVTDHFSGLAGATFLVNYMSKNISFDDLNDLYRLTKNLAKG